ncbi:MAG: MFS transporter [Spirochaetaceae bacterium]|nr:MFS transporter [Spirochaetaceae bacterium]
MKKDSFGTAGIQAQKIGFGEKVGYGLGDFASNLVWGAVGSFMVFFYTDIAGIAAAAIGTVMLISRIFDGFSDILMGIVMDKTKSRHGKARPWLLWMAIPYGVSAVLLFTVPPFGETGKIIYAFVTYNLATTVIYTAINIPYGAMTALITQDQYQRTVINIFRMVFAMVGALFVNMATVPLVGAMGGGATGWQRAFMVYGAVGAVIFMMCFFSTRERVKPAQAEKAVVPVKEGIKALKYNKPWMIMLALGLCVFIGQGLGGANIYYAQYILGDAGKMSLLMMAQFLPLIVGLFAMAPVIKRHGKRNTALAGSVIGIGGSLVQIAAPTSFVPVLVGMAIKGFAMAPLAGTVFAMIADTIEYGEWKSGVRTEGLVYSAASFGGKVGSGVGVGMVGWILAWGGYVAGAPTQSANALFAIKAMFLYIPVAISAITILLLLAYKLDKQYPMIVEELHRRNNGGAEGRQA